MMHVRDEIITEKVILALTMFICSQLHKKKPFKQQNTISSEQKIKYYIATCNIKLRKYLT